jgi:hypothetical protein
MMCETIVYNAITREEHLGESLVAAITTGWNESKKPFESPEAEAGKIEYKRRIEP